MNFFKKILDNYNLSLQDYKADYKSDLWTDFYKIFSEKL